MDESLSNLYAKLRNQIRAEIIKLRKRIDATFVYVTHDLTEAMTLDDRIIVMKDGFVQQIGSPQMNYPDEELIVNNGKYAVKVDDLTVELSIDMHGRLKVNNASQQNNYSRCKTLSPLNC